MPLPSNAPHAPPKIAPAKIPKPPVKTPPQKPPSIAPPTAPIKSPPATCPPPISTPCKLAIWSLLNKTIQFFKFCVQYDSDAFAISTEH